MKVAVVGAGSWGSALANVLGTKGCNVSLWARRQELVSAINTTHINDDYLPGIELSGNIVASTSLADCLSGAQAAVVVTPSKLLRGVAQSLASTAPADLPVIICTKGVEEASCLLATQVFTEEMGNAGRFAVLSGPNHAEEVVKGVPSATVIASEDAQTAAFFQDVFATDAFRVYTSGDHRGVQLCGAAKNPIAIAVGAAYGLGYGDNTAAMLMTRGLAEMSRLVSAVGGEALTCMGLAGMGDLVVTCTSEHSRNRRFGRMLAQGKTLRDFTDEVHMVAEGAYASRSLTDLAAQLGIEMPITQVVRTIVWEGADMSSVADALLARPLKQEFYGL